MTDLLAHGLLCKTSDSLFHPVLLPGRDLVTFSFPIVTFRSAKEAKRNVTFAEL